MTERIAVRNRNSIFSLQSILITLIIFAAAAAGVYLGMSLRGRNSVPQPLEASENPNAPTTQLKAGVAFPEVQLCDESGAPVNTSKLLGGKGGVVLFMELGCPPCKEMSDKWQAAIESGEAKDVSLIGITVNGPVYIRPYRLKNKLTFPIYSDTSNIFMDKYNITNYPLELVIGKSGKVTYSTFDSNEPIDFSQLKKQLEG